MAIYRSLIFIPSSSTKMLDKIGQINPDGYILDLEDSVPLESKEIARVNINNKIKELSGKDFPCSKKIFIRINEMGSPASEKDIEDTLQPYICGYVIPKFEDIEKLKNLEKNLLKKEKSKGILSGKIRTILMVESPAGLVEVLKIANFRSELFFKRISAIALGYEDYKSSMSSMGELSEDMLDYVRKSTATYAKASSFLAIDTVYKNFKDSDGLKKDTLKAAGMGFDGRLAIHPLQIEVINSCFMPSAEDIKKMGIILSNKERIENEGAINIDGVMYDPPHLKWALDMEKYLNSIKDK